MTLCNCGVPEREGALFTWGVPCTAGAPDGPCAPASDNGTPHTIARRMRSCSSSSLERWGTGGVQTAVLGGVKSVRASCCEWSRVCSFFMVGKAVLLMTVGPSCDDQIEGDTAGSWDCSPAISVRRPQYPQN